MYCHWVCAPVSVSKLPDGSDTGRFLFFFFFFLAGRAPVFFAWHSGRCTMIVNQTAPEILMLFQTNPFLSLSFTTGFFFFFFFSTLACVWCLCDPSARALIFHQIRFLWRECHKSKLKKPGGTNAGRGWEACCYRKFNTIQNLRVPRTRALLLLSASPKIPPYSPLHPHARHYPTWWKEKRNAEW